MQLCFMFSERVHAENFFVMILDRVVKKEFFISNDTEEKRKHQTIPLKKQQRIFRDICLCSCSQFWK